MNLRALEHNKAAVTKEDDEVMDILEKYPNDHEDNDYHILPMTDEAREMITRTTRTADILGQRPLSNPGPIVITRVDDNTGPTQAPALQQIGPITSGDELFRIQCGCGNTLVVTGNFVIELNDATFRCSECGDVAATINTND
ncbi:MAG: hypothetical protein GY861_26975 [bacterium]|nr:hypothetical protein [bacterium]